MVRNILIISSNYTGHGHKSITDSLCEQFSLYPEVKVQVIDGFALAGNLGLRLGKLYGSVTRNAKDIWKIFWEISQKAPELFNEFTALSIRENFIKLLKEVQPDLILCVHPNYNGSVLNILQDLKVEIPFVTLLADLVSITPLWADPRADYTLCPTEESKMRCLAYGVPEQKLRVFGFPVRSRFCSGENIQNNNYNTEKPLQCLIMSGGEGSGNMGSIAKILLKNYNCNIRIITGRNNLLKRRLEKNLLDDYPGRVEIFGFVENIQELMRSSDIAFTRGSPNVMMEAVNCNVPLIITGALPGQEEGNPGYAQTYNLGVVCTDLRKLRGLVNELLANGAAKLNGIKESQKEFRDPNISKKIVDFILSIETKGTVQIKNTIKSKQKKHNEVKNK